MGVGRGDEGRNVLERQLTPKVQGLRKKTLLRNCRGLFHFNLAELRVLAGKWREIEQPAYKGLAY